MEGTALVDVVLATKGDALTVHLITWAANSVTRSSTCSTKYRPLGPFKVRVRCAAEPAGRHPGAGGLSPHCEFADGVLAVDVTRLEIHSMVVLSP